MTDVAIIDGDAFVYRCGFAAEKTHYLVEAQGDFKKFDSSRDADKFIKEGVAAGFMDSVKWSRKEVEPLENCLQIVNTSIQNTLKVLGTDEYRIYLSGRRNFRDDIYPDYKANRDSATRPKYFSDIRNHLLGKWRGQLCDGIEADDAVGIAGVELGSRAIIVAQDKDLDQIPGRHYNWTTGETYEVTARGGLSFFYEQMLSGDSTDNIPGIDGIGPVKARKALAACTSPQECARVVRTAYEGQDWGITVDNAIERNASLLWIQRKKDDKHPFWKHWI